MISAAWSCEIFTSEIFLEGCCLKECGWSSGNFSNPNSRVYYDVIFLIIDISNTLPDFIGFSPIFHSNAHTWPHFLRCERNFSVILTRWYLFAVRRPSKLVKRWWINYRNNCAEKFAQTILSVSRYYRVLMRVLGIIKTSDITSSSPIILYSVPRDNGDPRISSQKWIS